MKSISNIFTSKNILIPLTVKLQSDKKIYVIPFAFLRNFAFWKITLPLLPYVWRKIFDFFAYFSMRDARVLLSSLRSSKKRHFPAVTLRGT